MLNVWITLGAIVAAVLLIAVVFPLIGRFLSPGAAPIKIPNPFKKLFAKESDGKKKESDGKKLAGYFIPSLVALGVVFLLIVIGLFVATSITTTLLGTSAFWGLVVAVVAGALLLNKKWTGAYVSLIIITILMMLIFGWDRDVSNAIASSTSTSSATQGNTSTGEPRQPQVVRAETFEEMPLKYGGPDNKGFIYLAPPMGDIEDPTSWPPWLDPSGQREADRVHWNATASRTGPSADFLKEYDRLRLEHNHGLYTDPQRVHRHGERPMYRLVADRIDKSTPVFIVYGDDFKNPEKLPTKSEKVANKVRYMSTTNQYVPIHVVWEKIP